MSMRMDERKAIWLISVAVMSITMLPYIYGYSRAGHQPGSSWYSGYAYDIADSTVYLSWMKQASDGHLFQRNLFTTEPQSGRQFNIFFLVLGLLVKITGLPFAIIYHAARLALGVAFLIAVWWLLGMLLASARARWAAFLITCLSSGFGWFQPLWELPVLESSVDTWQPEAITFLALYFSPLFAVSLLLMTGFIGWLWVAEQQHSYRAAVYAGVCGFLLGNIHTYDVITVGAVWGSYLFVRRRVEGRWPGEALRYALVAGAMTFLSMAYTAYAIMTDPVFAKRAAVPTLSPSFLLYLLGYGMVLLLATAGIYLLYRQMRVKKKEEALPETKPKTKGGKEKGAAKKQPPPSREIIEWARNNQAALLLISWAVVNLAITYIPISFQRRLLMGEHIALSALAGIGLAGLFENIAAWKWRALVAVSVLILSITNVRFLARDMSNLKNNIGMDNIVRPYLYEGERSALAWIGENAPPGSSIQPLPWIRHGAYGEPQLADLSVASYTPGLTGHAVNLGHWGETPNFGSTLNKWLYFMLATTTDQWRQDFLRSTGVRYLMFTQKNGGMEYPAFLANPPSYIKRIEEASNADADLYEVELK